MDAYSEHYRTSGYSRFPQERRVSGSAGVPILAVQQDTHDHTDPAVDALVIAAARRTDMAFSWNIGDGWTKPARVADGSLHVVPPNTAAQIRAHGRQDMLFIVLDRAIEQRFLRPNGNTLEDLARANTDYFQVPSMVKRLDLLWNLSRHDDPGDSLRSDAILLEILSNLQQRATGATRTHQAYRGGLAPHALRKAKSMLEDGIEAPVGIEEIAASVGLSQFHFLRAFRESTGTPPHRWQVERRLERAQSLLRDTNQTVTEIAQSVGYQSGQALARAFRQHIGISPLSYRGRDTRE